MHTFCHPWVIFAYGGTVWHQDQTSDGFGSIPPRNVTAERHRSDIQIVGELVYLSSTIFAGPPWEGIKARVTRNAGHPVSSDSNHRHGAGTKRGNGNNH